MNSFRLGQFPQSRDRCSNRRRTFRTTIMKTTPRRSWPMKNPHSAKRNRSGYGIALHFIETILFVLKIFKMICSSSRIIVVTFVYCEILKLIKIRIFKFSEPKKRKKTIARTCRTTSSWPAASLTISTRNSQQTWLGGN